MKKFKLIKLYPGIPSVLEIGDVVEKDKDNTWKYRKFFSTIWNDEYFEKYPEFWKPVEKEYEILQFKYIFEGGEGIDRQLGKDGLYHLVNRVVTDPKSLEHCLSLPQYHIKSVKRLSDGEVFTVGDKIEFNKNCKNKAPGIITSIVQYRGIIGFIDSNQSFNSILDIIGNKIKKILFTTKDGVDIYEGDEYYSIYKNLQSATQVSPLRSIGTITKQYNGLQTLLYFSTKEKAEEYIFMNKPCLSLNDVIGGNNLVSPSLYKNLLELVKSKLK